MSILETYCVIAISFIVHVVLHGKWSGQIRRSRPWNSQSKMQGRQKIQVGNKKTIIRLPPKSLDWLFDFLVLILNTKNSTFTLNSSTSLSIIWSKLCNKENATHLMLGYIYMITLGGKTIKRHGLIFSILFHFSYLICWMKIFLMNKQYIQCQLSSYHWYTELPMLITNMNLSNTKISLVIVR